MNKKRILLIGPVPPPSGGVSVHLSRLLKRANDHPDLELAVFDLRKLKLFCSDGKSKNIFSAIVYFLSAKIIHVHVFHSVKVFIARVSRLFGKKVFYTLHNPRCLETNSMLSMMRLSEKIIFVFDPGNIPENGIIIPAYIPADEIASLPAGLDEKLKVFSHIVVSVSSYSGRTKIEEDVYGFDIILEAIKNLTSTLETVLVLIDSTGALKKRYENTIREIENKSGINIFYIDYDINFSKLLSQSTVFIRATRSDGDAVSVREALNEGIPVLASDCAARPEGCIVFHSGDVKALSECLNEVLANPAKRIFPEEDFSGKILELYSTL